MIVFLVQGMAGKRTQKTEENMAAEETVAIFQDLVTMAGIPTAKAQFGATMMMRTTK